MSPRLSREASALLDAVRGTEEPTDEDEARVKRALDDSVAAGVTCHWERYAVRGDAAGEDAAPGDAAAPPAADLGNAATTVAKASAVAWAAPLSVVALCAAAFFATPLFTDQAAPPDAADQQGQRTAAAREAPTADTPTADTATPPEASARSTDVARSKVSPLPSRAAPPHRPGPAQHPRSAQRPESSELGAELALLQRAQAALRRGDGAGALHELEAFPDSGGQLLAERRVVRVLALCSLSRVAEAQALAAEVLRTDPGSVQRAALERSCANPSRNRGP